MRRDEDFLESKTIALFLMAGTALMLAVFNTIFFNVTEIDTLPAQILSGDMCPDVVIDETGAGGGRGPTQEFALAKAIEEATNQAIANCKASDFRNLHCQPTNKCIKGSGAPGEGPVSILSQSCHPPGRPTEPDSTDYKCDVVVGVSCSIICVPRLVPRT